MSDTTKHPHVSPKVTAATVGTGTAGAVGTLVLFALAQAGIELDAATSAAVLTLVAAAVTFAVGYLKRDQDRI